MAFDLVGEATEDILYLTRRDIIAIVENIKLWFYHRRGSQTSIIRSLVVLRLLVESAAVSAGSITIPC